MKRIFLVRHAQPELGGKSHVCLGGRSDVPLSPEGEMQAAAAAGCFPDHIDFKLYSSPMLRARQTAQLISAGRWPVEVLPGMEESIFPGLQSMFNPDDVEEERRLAYAGITRAERVEGT